MDPETAEGPFVVKAVETCLLVPSILPLLGLQRHIKRIMVFEDLEDLLDHLFCNHYSRKV